MFSANPSTKGLSRNPGETYAIAPGRPFRIDVHDHVEAVSAAAWDDLAQRASGGSIFQSYAWHNAVARSRGVSDDLYIVCVLEGNRLLAIAPFYRSRRGETKVLRLLGDEHAGSCDIIFDPAEEWVLGEVFAHLRSHPEVADELQFVNVAHTSPTVRTAELLHTGHGLMLQRTVHPPCRVMNLEHHQMHPDGISTIGHQAEHDPEVLHLTSPDAIGPLLNTFFTQHIQERITAETSQFVVRSNRDFCRNLVDTFAPAGSLSLTMFSSSGNPVAFHLGIVDRNVLVSYEHSSCPDTEMRPGGRVILRSLITYAKGRGLARIDLTRTAGRVGVFADTSAETRVSMTVTFTGACGRAARAKAFVRRSAAGRAMASWAKEAAETAYVILRRHRMVTAERLACMDDDTTGRYYDRVVADWSRKAELQKAEIAVIDELRGELRKMKMLDIGVGAGRTSVYFAPQAKEYVAVDVSQEMVRACRELLGDYVPPSCFTHGDARNMKDLPDHSFDFILFSFNGIDCVSAEDRTLILSEVQRLAKDGAWFCFSSHNLNSLTWRGATNLREFLQRWRRYLLLSAANGHFADLAGRTSASILDGGQHYRLPLYYVTPAEQIRRLKEMGFRGTRAFSCRTGAELKRDDEIDSCVDSWIYYLCRA